MPIYAAQGVQHLWLVELVNFLLEAHALENGRWSWLGTWSDDAAAVIPPFDAVPLDLARPWQDTGLRG